MLRKWIALVVVTLLLACSQEAPVSSSPERVELEVWAHAGQEGERKVIEDQVARFNQQRSGVQIKLTLLPERSYNAQVQAAALAGDLPDVLEFDGPYLYNYIWQRQLQPLEGLLPSEATQDLLPSIVEQGRYQGHLYAVGTFDSGLGLYARRSLLDKTGIRIPRGIEDAWTAAEFAKALSTLAVSDDDGTVLDLKLNYAGEWFTYAFSPVIQSAGGDLVDRKAYRTAAKVLDGALAVAGMQQLQSWFEKGYVDSNVDDGAFVTGKVALSWAGHWEYPRYKATIGDDLVLLPLPDFGQGSRTGQGSWVWGVSSGTAHAKEAASFLAFLLETKEVLLMADANGAVPGTKEAVKQSDLYRKGGDLRLFSEQLVRGHAVPRPQTPAYPVITSAFQTAFHDIRNGADVQAALHAAVKLIDQDIIDNKGYP